MITWKEIELLFVQVAGYLLEEFTLLVVDYLKFHHQKSKPNILSG